MQVTALHEGYTRVITAATTGSPTDFTSNNHGLVSPTIIKLAVKFTDGSEINGYFEATYDSTNVFEVSYDSTGKTFASGSFYVTKSGKGSIRGSGAGDFGTYRASMQDTDAGGLATGAALSARMAVLFVSADIAVATGLADLRFQLWGGPNSEHLLPLLPGDSGADALLSARGVFTDQTYPSDRFQGSFIIGTMWPFIKLTLTNISGGTNNFRLWLVTGGQNR